MAKNCRFFLMLMPLPNSRFITQYFLHFFSFNHLQSKSVGLTLVCVFWCDEKKKSCAEGNLLCTWAISPSVASWLLGQIELTKRFVNVCSIDFCSHLSSIWVKCYLPGGGGFVTLVVLFFHSPGKFMMPAKDRTKNITHWNVHHFSEQLSLFFVQPPVPMGMEMKIELHNTAPKPPDWPGWAPESSLSVELYWGITPSGKLNFYPARIVKAFE